MDHKGLNSLEQFRSVAKVRKKFESPILLFKIKKSLKSKNHCYAFFPNSQVILENFDKLIKSILNVTVRFDFLVPSSLFLLKMRIILSQKLY